MSVSRTARSSPLPVPLYPFPFTRSPFPLFPFFPFLQSRKRKTELRSATAFGVEIYAAAMLLNHFTHERQSQSGRLFVFFLAFAHHAIKLFPHSISGLGGDAVTAILNRQSDSFRLKRR